MKEIAKGVWQFSGFPPNAINAYLVHDVLIDGATRWAKWRILRQLRKRKLSLVALTHCHPDHQGVVHVVCEKFSVPLACHSADVEFMEGRQPMQPRSPLVDWAVRNWAGPPHAVSHVLKDGDDVAGFRVVHAPGHTPGHVIYFRQSDRVAIAGDVLANISFLTGRSGLREPPARFSVDWGENRRSMQVLVALKPSVVCFGHGPPLRDLHLLQHFVSRLLPRGSNTA